MVCSLSKGGKGFQDPRRPPRSPLSAGSRQEALPSAHLIAPLLPWGQRFGCRADNGQAASVGTGSGEGAITPACHSLYPPPPRRGAWGEHVGNRRLCLGGWEAGQAGGCTGSGPGSGGAATQASSWRYLGGAGCEVPSPHFLAWDGSGKAG